MFTLSTAHVVADAPLSFSVRRRTTGPCTRWRWEVSNDSNTTFRGTLRLTAAWPKAFRNPWVLVPGFFYGENRRDSQWSPKLYPKYDPNLTEPRDMASSCWDFPADRCAAPLVYLHEGENVFAIASLPHYDCSAEVESDDAEPQVGVGFGRNAENGHIRFSFPACDEPFTYTNSPERGPTLRRLRIPPGGTVGGTLFVYEGNGDRHGYQPILEHYLATVAPAYPPAALPEIVSLVRDAATGVLKHYEPKQNYFIYSRPYDPVIEQIGNCRGITMEWHQMMTGFVSGFPTCAGLLAAAEVTGDAAARDVARRVADRICTEGVSPSGLFWADFMPRTIETPLGPMPNPLFRADRHEWGSGWLSGTTRVHSRTIGDACDSLAAMITRERRVHHGSPSLPIWEKALLGNLRTVLDLQLPNGSYGQYYDAVARKIVKEDGCGGLLWIPAMLKAIRLGLGGPAMVEAMQASVRRAADAYAPYVEAEYIWGAPEDNDSPTSEDGMNAIAAYADLYEMFDDERHLALARRAADWTLTFRKTYNVRLPPDSLMGRYDLRSRGADFASSSNNHLHVFECLVTRQLCNLSRWTGNAYYRERAEDHWRFVCQYLSRCDGMYNGFRGAMAEQFYWTNWGSWGGTYQPPAYHRQKGNMAPFTAVWCIHVLLLAAEDAWREFYE